jgi:hypothetical protein
MEEYKITLPGWQCLRCSHQWQAKAEKAPMVCPNRVVRLTGKHAVAKTLLKKRVKEPKPVEFLSPKLYAEKINEEIKFERENPIPILSTPQHIPQKDITPDNQDEIQKECFLCAKDLKFDCQARKDLLPVKDICNACLGQAFWGSSDMYRDAYDMEPEIVFDNPGATDDVSRLKAIAYGCKFKIKYPNMIICPNKDRGKIVNEACTYCWELEELWGTAAAGYLERRKK